MPDLVPELLWSQILGDATTSLRTEPLRRMQPAYLAYANGVIVCPTNSGAVVAVDTNARSLLWARFYGTPVDAKADPEMPGFRAGRIRGGGLRMNADGSMSVPVPTDRWRAAAPMIVGTRLILAAYDSDRLQCLDLRTGETVWDVARDADDLYVGGVAGNNVVIVGKKSIRAYPVQTPSTRPGPVWPAVATGTPVGHGTVGADGLFYVPFVTTPDRLDAADPQVWAIDVATGAVKAKTAFRRPLDPADDPRLTLGNLVFHDGLMMSQSATELAAFPLLGPKRAEMLAKLAADPDNPDGLATRGELALDAGDLPAAVADFKKALTATAPDAVRSRVRQKLYGVYTELLRNDFAAGEPFLADYEALCAVPVDADDPADRQRQLDEGVRRRALYLAVVGKGREKQGRAADAVEAYRAFALVGDAKQLVSVPDEPSGQTRPDVWAQGRIDAVVRAAGPADRAALEAKLEAAAATAAAGPVAGLRAFVAGIGPAVRAGRMARLALADKLIALDDSDASRDAAAILTQLAAVPDDPDAAAKALDRLITLGGRRGQPEDVVGLAAELGPNTPPRRYGRA